MYMYMFALNFCLKTKMESQNIEFRTVIQFLTNEDVNAKEIHRRMADVYSDSGPTSFVTFISDVLGQVWCLIASIPDF